MNTPTSNSRPLSLVAIGTLVVLAVTLVSAAQSYASGKINGVRAAVNHGTLNVTGSDGGQQVALRLKAGDPSRIQVDAGNDGSADRSFASRDVAAIKSQWALDKRWQPQMAQAQRERLYARWQKAVQRSFDWLP